MAEKRKMPEKAKFPKKDLPTPKSGKKPRKIDNRGKKGERKYYK